MDIIRHIAKKDSIREYITLEFSTFESKEKYTSRRKIEIVPKFTITETIVAKNYNEIKELEKFLSKNITELIVFPLFSTTTKATVTETTNIVNGDFVEPWTKPGDVLCFGKDTKNLKYETIIAIDSINKQITLQNDININDKDLLITGKIMTLNKQITINKTSNTFWEFNIKGSEL